MNFNRRPILVFWETTRACLLACHHCRASAIATPLPDEFSPAEGEHLLEMIAGFGRPRDSLDLSQVPMRRSPRRTRSLARM